MGFTDKIQGVKSRDITQSLCDLGDDNVPVDDGTEQMGVQFIDYTLNLFEPAFVI